MHVASRLLSFAARARVFRRLAARLFLLGVLGLWPGLLVAQLPRPAALLSATELKRLSVEELLEQEVVSVSRRPEALGKAAGNVFYIAGDAARVTGATALPELLRLAPNLFVAQVSSYNWGINARGLMRSSGASNKMLVLVDGRTAYSPLFSNVFWDATDVFLPDLDNIEVISGPAGSTWGSNAVNGVISIRSKSARDTKGGLLQVSGGTRGTQVSARQGFSVGANGAMRIYARRTDREPTFSSTGSDDDYDQWHTTQTGLRADWGTSGSGEITVQGDWQAGRYDAGSGLAKIRNDNGNLLVRWARDLAPDSQLWVRAYYDYVLRDTRGQLRETTETADVEFQHAKQFAGGQEFLWGANYRRIYDRTENTPAFIILPSDKWLSLASVFAQHEIAWADESFRLTTGLRLEHNDYTGWESQPTLRLAWHPGKQTFWLSGARAVRTPSRLEKELFAPAVPPYFFAGGPDFRSETLISYEAGWRGQPAPGVSLTATAYFHDYDHLHTVEATTPIVEANGAEGRTYGLELFLDYEVTPAWRLRVGGFAMKQETWLKPGSLDTGGGVAEASFPRTQLFLRNGFRLSADADLWLSLRRIGEVPPNASPQGTVPAYTELNASFTWRMRPHLELGLIGRNLLDRSHPEIGPAATRREIPRSFSASLRWEY